METETQKSPARPESETALADSPLVEALDSAIGVTATLGNEFAADVQNLRTLKARLGEERFHLAVLGQFKRGKSTLINALLGDEVLPTSVVPLTSIPTFLRAGDKLAAVVVKQDDSEAEHFSASEPQMLCRFLARYVTEEANPKNRLGVSFVDVCHPAAILRQGVVLIDTPGIGSTFRHNTEATLNFLPQCDAALFVMSADPPLTEVEVEFLKIVRSKISRLFFILNKVDYLTEQEKQTAIRFLEKVLHEQVGIPDGSPIFCVSARQGLEARRSGNAQQWAQSGLEEVENHLIEFLVFEKNDALQHALAKKGWDIVGDVLLRLQLTIRSLQMPLAELDQRMQLFEQKLKLAEQQRVSTADMLSGDKRRLEEFIEHQAEQLRRAARKHLGEIIRQSLERTKGSAVDENAIQQQLAEAIPVFFEHQLGEMMQLCSQRMSEVLQTHLQRADELTESVRRAAAELFDVPYHPKDSTSMVTMARRPYWVTHQWDSLLNPLPADLLIKLLPQRMRRTRIKKRLMEQLHLLVLHNVENLRWSALQNVDQTFRLFGANLDETFRQTIDATIAAIQAARRKREETTGEVETKIAQLNSVVAELQATRDKLASLMPSRK